ALPILERGTRGVSHLPGARQTTGNRHPLSPSDAEPSRAARHGPLYPGSRMAGGHGSEGDGPPATAPSADDHAERQRKQPARAHPAPPAQAEKEIGRAHV